MFVLTASGCLSIGGKTEFVASPEADMRMSSLESRVATLERTLGVSSVPTTLSSEDANRRSSTTAKTVSATTATTAKQDERDENGNLGNFRFTMDPQGR